MNKETEQFITEHNIPKELLFNAEGKPVSHVKDKMKQENQYFAYNTTECYQGHNFRSRSGHCVICDPAKITFTLRNVGIGRIYIACSFRTQQTKVGFTKEEIPTRMAKLNSRKVGQTDDWEVVKYYELLNGNKAELKIHKELEPYRVTGSTYGDTESRELFQCSYQKALEATEKIMKGMGIEPIKTKLLSHSLDKYNFRNLRKK
ncbi:GIY-YIG nuclease family protein [Robertkochia solimangrovi]|uniref:GIY-YIG nuclease family protein n=1 Tax=Robertkochia solimangrovi TaxID=2213046 RepID=UPI00117E06E3|nr:GIY-YIG nuclease family protein [Robertkochia solimangrovi]TRZ41665.1 hypothetical protein DMZ48_16795 [Robertkochia solimangrovi]